MINGSASRESNSNNNRYLNFSLGKEEYAILLLSVKEVIAIPEITSLPFTPDYYLGIMNLRGQVISVIDLRKKLMIKPTQSTETAIIICDMGSFSLGVVVDSINSVITPNEVDISTKSGAQTSKTAEYISGVVKWNDQLIVLIDIIKLLNVEDIKSFSNPANQKSA